MKEKLKEIYDRIFTYYYWFDEIRNPFAWLTDRKHKIKNLWVRYRRGVGCCDLFGYNDYICRKIGKDLRIYHEHNMSWPGNDEFKTMESWQEFILKLADDLDYTLVDDSAEGWIDRENELERKQHEAMEKFGKYVGHFWI